MSATATRRAPIAGLMLATGGGAWVWVLVRWGDMGSMPGTMGRDLPAFDAMWTVMMAAMMLPATAPIASIYSRSISSHRAPRMALFTCGYLGLWGAAGLPAYALAVGAGHAAGERPAVGTAVAAVMFAINGAYQLSRWKDRCLSRCRTPIGLLLCYASWRGPSRDLRAGAHHGAFCLACCSTLMALLAAFGIMNLWAMVGLTAVVAIEKATPVGSAFARVIGIASLACAVAVFWVPAIAPGLTGGGPMSAGAM